MDNEASKDVKESQNEDVGKMMIAHTIYEQRGKSNLMYSHTHSLTHTFCLPISPSLSLSQILTFLLSLSLAQALSFLLSLPHTHTQTHTHSFSPPFLSLCFNSYNTHTTFSLLRLSKQSDGERVSGLFLSLSFLNDVTCSYCVDSLML